MRCHGRRGWVGGAWTRPGDQRRQRGALLRCCVAVWRGGASAPWPLAAAALPCHRRVPAPRRSHCAQGHRLCPAHRRQQPLARWLARCASVRGGSAQRCRARARGAPRCCACRSGARAAGGRGAAGEPVRRRLCRRARRRRTSAGCCRPGPRQPHGRRGRRGGRGLGVCGRGGNVGAHVWPCRRHAGVPGKCRCCRGCGCGCSSVRCRRRRRTVHGDTHRQRCGVLISRRGSSIRLLTQGQGPVLHRACGRCRRRVPRSAMCGHLEHNHDGSGGAPPAVSTTHAARLLADS
mmetsp:Transcript_14181/g.41224  ORF Transcript_14181/g.41224 Transcript_14181/m.41224 type:complete len:291 (+) Transcript_14181:1049-1921(+)